MNGSRTFVVGAIQADPGLKTQYEALFGSLPDVSGIDPSAKPTTTDPVANER